MPAMRSLTLSPINFYTIFTLTLPNGLYAAVGLLTQERSVALCSDTALPFLHPWLEFERQTQWRVEGLSTDPQSLLNALAVTLSMQGEQQFRVQLLDSCSGIKLSICAVGTRCSPASFVLCRASVNRSSRAAFVPTLWVVQTSTSFYPCSSWSV